MQSELVESSVEYEFVNVMQAVDKLIVSVATARNMKYDQKFEALRLVALLGKEVRLGLRIST